MAARAHRRASGVGGGVWAGGAGTLGPRTDRALIVVDHDASAAERGARGLSVPGAKLKR